MAKQRRVGNLLALAVLSAVAYRPMHPYEMAPGPARLGQGPGHGDQVGLALHGRAQPGQARPAGGRGEHPRRAPAPSAPSTGSPTTGRAELVDWARELVSTPEPEQPPVQGRAVRAGRAAPRGGRRAAAASGSTLLDDRDRRPARGADRHAGTFPRLFLVEDEYELAMREAEAAWVRALLDELDSGHATPGMAEWRAWHETGEMPGASSPSWRKGRSPAPEPHRPSRTGPRRRCCNTAAGPSTLEPTPRKATRPRGGNHRITGRSPRAVHAHRPHAPDRPRTPWETPMSDVTNRDRHRRRHRRPGGRDGPAQGRHRGHRARGPPRPGRRHRRQPRPRPERAGRAGPPRRRAAPWPPASPITSTAMAVGGDSRVELPRLAGPAAAAPGRTAATCTARCTASPPSRAFRSCTAAAWSAWTRPRPASPPGSPTAAPRPRTCSSAPTACTRPSAR